MTKFLNLVTLKPETEAGDPAAEPGGKEVKKFIQMILDLVIILVEFALKLVTLCSGNFGPAQSGIGGDSAVGMSRMESDRGQPSEVENEQP